MRFQWPAMLWGLLLVPLVAAAYALWQRRRARSGQAFANPALLPNLVPRRPGWRRHLPVALYLLALGVLVVGLARPETTVRVSREQATVMLAVDVSGSMLARDVRPDRLSAAREAVGAFLDRAPAGYRVGLVTFAGTARAAVAPTTDRAAVRDALAAAQPAPGTAMGDAIDRALDVRRQELAEATTSTRGQGPQPGPTPGGPGEEEPSLAVLVLSDGRTTSGMSPLAAAEAARGLDVPVSTVAFGTAGGEAAPDGPVRPEPPDLATLEQVAELTGGEFYTAPSGPDLARVYAGLASRLRPVEEDQEITALALGAAMLLCLVGGVGALRAFGRLP